MSITMILSTDENLMAEIEIKKQVMFPNVSDEDRAFFKPSLKYSLTSNPLDDPEILNRAQCRQRLHELVDKWLDLVEETNYTTPTTKKSTFIEHQSPKTQDRINKVRKILNEQEQEEEEMDLDSTKSQQNLLTLQPVENDTETPIDEVFLASTRPDDNLHNSLVYNVMVKQPDNNASNSEGEPMYV